MTAAPAVERTFAPPRATDEVVEWAWRSGPCAALEHRFELLVEPEGVGPRLERLLAPFRIRQASDPTTRSLYRIRADGTDRLPLNLYFDDEHLTEGRSARDLTGMLTWHLNGSTVGRSADRYLLLHASAATRSGMTVILPADMESGKTTTVAGLLREGFDYVTDEAVAIDPDTCRVTPFPKTLSLDPGSWGLFPECRPLAEVRPLQWNVEPAQLGARTARASVAAPRFVVFPQYVAGAETALAPLSRAEAVSELARMTFHFSRHPGRNLAAIKKVCAQATLRRLTIGSLDGAVAAIEGLISNHILENL